MLLEDGDYYWQGSEEECNDCHNLYPMCWIIFDGKYFKCWNCYYKNLKQEEEYEKKQNKNLQNI